MQLNFLYISNTLFSVYLCKACMSIPCNIQKQIHLQFDIFQRSGMKTKLIPVFILLRDE
jgi:hypothetical protein